MAIKKYKPTSNGRRNMTGYDFSEITASKPEKTLLSSLFVIKVAVTNALTVSSISNVTKTT